MHDVRQSVPSILSQSLQYEMPHAAIGVRLFSGHECQSFDGRKKHSSSFLKEGGTWLQITALHLHTWHPRSLSLFYQCTSCVTVRHLYCARLPHSLTRLKSRKRLKDRTWAVPPLAWQTQSCASLTRLQSRKQKKSMGAMTANCTN